MASMASSNRIPLRGLVLAEHLLDRLDVDPNDRVRTDLRGEDHVTSDHSNSTMPFMMGVESDQVTLVVADERVRLRP